MVSFLIVGLKCNLILVELFVFSSFETGKLVWCRTTVQKKMAAVHFAKMPCELDTVNLGTLESRILRDSSLY